MALYLNLYHEIQKQKLKRQRDPFKIGIMITLMIMVGFIAWYFWRLESVQHSKREMLRLQAEWKTTEPSQKIATARRDELDANLKARDTMVHQIENRFYWAPVLEHLVHVVPADVQISNLEAKVINSGSKKVAIAITGIAAGAQPRIIAENLRTALQTEFSKNYQMASSTFAGSGGLEDSAETVQYQGRTMPIATFTINLSFLSLDISDSEKAPEKPQRAAKP